MQRIVELTQRLEHHLLVPKQYKGGRHSVKGFKGCGLVVGRKDGLLWSSYQGFFWEKYLDGTAFCPKKASKGLGPFDACHRGKW